MHSAPCSQCFMECELWFTIDFLIPNTDKCRFMLNLTTIDDFQNAWNIIITLFVSHFCHNFFYFLPLPFIPLISRYIWLNVLICSSFNFNSLNFSHLWLNICRTLNILIGDGHPEILVCESVWKIKTDQKWRFLSRS